MSDNAVNPTGREVPRGEAPGPSFFWSRTRQMAARRLRFALQNPVPMTAVYGPAESGKSSLIRQVVSEAGGGEAPRICLVSNPELLSEEFPSLLGALLDAEDPARAGAPAGISFSGGGVSHVEPVLVVDGAERLAPGRLADLGALVEGADLRLILAGRSSMLDAARAALPTLLRNSIRVAPFVEAEAAEYARTLLPAAPSAAALEAIQVRTGGLPGRIRALCRACSVAMADKGETGLTPDLIRSVPIEDAPFLLTPAPAEIRAADPETATRTPEPAAPETDGADEAQPQAPATVAPVSPPDPPEDAPPDAPPAPALVAQRPPAPPAPAEPRSRRRLRKFVLRMTIAIGIGAAMGIVLGSVALILAP